MIETIGRQQRRGGANVSPTAGKSTRGSPRDLQLGGRPQAAMAVDIMTGR